MVQDVHVELNQDCRGKNSIQQEDFFHLQIGHNFKEELVECYISSIALYMLWWTLRKVDQKYL
jgi:hypothetical protein